MKLLLPILLGTGGFEKKEVAVNVALSRMGVLRMFLDSRLLPGDSFPYWNCVDLLGHVLNRDEDLSLPLQRDEDLSLPLQNEGS